MKVKIQNFQSIKEVELEVEGFTAIVGRSNIGKSAIVRAIEGAFSNKEGENFVREGTKFTEVDIECPEINLNWKKGSGYNDYIIDGEKLESVGRGAPPHIAEAGFHEIETNRTKLNVQIASQFSPIFLIDPSKTSGSIAAEIISDIGRLSEVQTALRDCSKDKRNLESTVRVREKDIINTREELELYDEIDDDMKQVEEIKTQHSDIGIFREQIGVMSELKEEKDDVEVVLERFENFDAVTVPEWSDGTLYDELRALETFFGAVSKHGHIITQYEGLDDITIPSFDEDDAIRQIRAFSQFQDHVESAQNDVDVLEGLDDIEMPDAEDLDELVTDCREYSEIQTKQESLTTAIPSLEKELEELDEAMTDIHEEIHDILVEAGECPMCGTEVDE